MSTRFASQSNATRISRPALGQKVQDENLSIAAAKAKSNTQRAAGAVKPAAILPQKRTAAALTDITNKKPAQAVAAKKPALQAAPAVRFLRLELLFFPK